MYFFIRDLAKLFFNVVKLLALSLVYPLLVLAEYIKSKEGKNVRTYHRKARK